MDDRPYLVVAAGGHLEALRRRALFEQAHPEVTIVDPGGLNDRWRAIVPLGKIPAHLDETTIGAWLLADLTDQLDGRTARGRPERAAEVPCLPDGGPAAGDDVSPGP